MVPHRPKGSMYHTNDGSNFQANNNKRKRDSDSSISPRIATSLPTRIQTTNIQTASSMRSEPEDSLSPRTVVSARFQGLNLQNECVTKTATVRSPEQRTARRSSTNMEDADKAGFTHIDERAEVSEACQDNSADTMRTISVQDIASVLVPPLQAPEVSEQLQHDLGHAKFNFTTGCALFLPTPSKRNDAPSSPRKRARFTPPPTDGEGEHEHHHEGSIRSPSKHVRRTSPSSTPRESATTTVALAASPSPSISPPIPRSRSPSARKLTSSPSYSTHKRSLSSSTSDTSISSADLWWQDSEISGHTPSDPDEDNRGVNGIGYQKTKAEARAISERKKKQIAEWRKRESGEARALRAGGRKGMGVIGGRVMKSPSPRPASPVKVKERGTRLEAGGAKEELVLESPRRRVKFEEG